MFILVTHYYVAPYKLEESKNQSKCKNFEDLVIGNNLVK